MDLSGRLGAPGGVRGLKSRSGRSGVTINYLPFRKVNPVYSVRSQSLY